MVTFDSQQSLYLEVEKGIANIEVVSVVVHAVFEDRKYERS